MVQIKASTYDEMAELIDELMLTLNRLSARDKGSEEKQMENFKFSPSKLDKVHIVAIFKHILKPKESTENQGRATSCIIQHFSIY